MKIRFVLIRPAIALVALLSLATGLQADLPDRVKEILEENIVASGGRENIEAIKSTRMAGSMKVPAMNMTATVLMVQAYPDYIYRNNNMTGIGEFVQAYDGKVAWSNDVMQGFRILGEDEKNEMIRQGGIRESLDYETTYSTGEQLADSMVGEEETYVLKLFSTISNSEETHYYSKESGLLLQMDMTANMGPMGELPATMKISGYTEHAGFTFPTTIQMVNPAMTMEMVISEIEVNPEIDPSIFAPPQ